MKQPSVSRGKEGEQESVGRGEGEDKEGVEMHLQAVPYT